ncbi:glycosidase [Vibrio wakamikoensis]|uniref:Glycosidase n=1 Tax=Vibrio chaetopteri TaxID=3016528 RepID=A0AAU8BPY8_9VIBR
MTSIKSALSMAVMSALMFGCASDPATSSANETATATTAAVAAAPAGVDTAMMAACDNPTVSEAGPVRKKLYVVGTFPGASWKHIDARAFEHKGDGLYQAVVEEQPGKYSMQYAAADWKPQFTADGRVLNVGETKVLKWGGYGKDTKSTIEATGKYVWSVKFDEKANPIAVSLNQCQ